MSVRKRKWTTRLGEAKEAWVVDYIDGQGDRHIKTFERKKEADDYRATVKVDVRAGTHIAPNKSITVAAAAESWLAHAEAEGLERATIENYRQHVRLHILPRIGKVKLAALTPDKVKAFRDSLLENLSRDLARKVVTSTKTMLKVAKHGHMVADLKIKQRKREDGNGKPEKGRDFPTPGEIKRLVEAAKNLKWRTLILVAALTGLRASELRGLRWADVDLKAGELHVRQRADRYGNIGQPKSEASARTVPLDPDVLVPALQKWWLACPKGEAGLVFPTRTAKVENHSNLLRGLAAIMVTANIVGKDGKAKYGPHSLRHFFASWCINRKVDGGRELPPKSVQVLLGHSSITMTLDRYGHLFPRNDDRTELAAATRALLA
jgi:integrase